MHSFDANLTTLTAIHTTFAMASRNTALSPLTDLLGGDLLPFRVPANRQAFFFPQIKVKTLSPNGSNPWNRMLSKGGANASIRGNKVSKVRVGDELSQVIGRYPPLPEMWERVGLDSDRKSFANFDFLKQGFCTHSHTELLWCYLTRTQEECRYILSVVDSALETPILDVLEGLWS